MKQAVFHVDEMEKWPMVLLNAKNMVNYYEENQIPHAVEVVATAVAVRGCLSAEAGSLEADMTALNGRGVVFAVCSNAMRMQKAAPEELLPFVRVVPAGVVELVDRQDDGYAYLRP